MDFKDEETKRALSIVKKSLQLKSTAALADATIKELSAIIPDVATRNAFRNVAGYLSRRYSRSQAREIIEWPLIGGFEESGTEMGEVGASMRQVVCLAIIEAARKIVKAEAEEMLKYASDPVENIKF